VIALSGLVRRRRRIPADAELALAD
jgi:hypothetical protein